MFLSMFPWLEATSLPIMINGDFASFFSHRLSSKRDRWRSLVVCDKWKQSHEASPQNSLTNSSLVDGGSSRSTAWQNLAFAVNQRSQCLHIFVINVNRTWNHTVRAEPARQLLTQSVPLFSQLLQIILRKRSHSIPSNSYGSTPRSRRHDKPDSSHEPGTPPTGESRSIFARFEVASVGRKFPAKFIQDLKLCGFAPDGFETANLPPENRSSRWSILPPDFCKSRCH